MERKLTAILSADVVGYSRLVEDDDEATIRTLTAYREMMRDLIDAHHGHVVDAPGDNLLAEFASVVDAVRCAVELQQSLWLRNAEQDPARRMAFRMGINVGDVVVEGERLYGDGVNIAARLEAMADAGGICLSGNAYEQVENKLDIEFEFDGEHTVKNISKPVAVWRVRMVHAEVAGSVGEDLTPASVTASPRSKQDRSATVLVLVLAALTVISIAIFFVLPPAAPPQTPTGTLATPPESAIPTEVSEPAATASVPTRPAVIVLPFTNISDDPAQDYFSDGFTEDITTDLAKLDSLYVVPSNAAFKYKGKAIEPAILKEEFGIRYLLEGSVRKAGDQVRISARLIDVVEDRHLWSERYDRALTDIFRVQDEIRGKILTALRVNLTDAEQERFKSARTSNLEAYDYFLRGQEMSHRARRELQPKLMDEAKRLYEQAIELDPDYAAAYGALGLAEWLIWFYQWGNEDDAGLARALAAIDQALARDPGNPYLVQYLNIALLHNHQFEVALANARKAFTQTPNFPETRITLGMALMYTGDFAGALQEFERAEALDPHLPSYAYWSHGMVLSLLGRDTEALDLVRRATLRAPNYLSNYVVLAIVYSKTGNKAEAAEAARQILRISPSYEAQTFSRTNPFVDESVSQNLIKALHDAGLP